MEFSNLEDTRLRLPVALILSYKRGTHTKKEESHQQRRKTEKKQEKHIIQEKDLGLHQMRNCRDQ